MFSALLDKIQTLIMYLLLRAAMWIMGEQL